MEGGLDAVQDFQVVFAERRDVTADSAEDFPAAFTAKTSRYLLLQFRHANVALALVVVERNLRVRQKCQRLRLEITQAIEQVLCF